MNIQGWFSLRFTGLISLLSKSLSGVFSSTTVGKHQFFSAQPSLWSNSDSSVCKESACNAADPDSIPGSGRSPRKGNGNPLHNSCLENSMERGAWWVNYCPWSLIESDTTEWPTLAQKTHLERYRKLLNCVGEDSWESPGLQGDQTS